MIHVRKILYTTDFSSYSNQAYFHAIALAEKHRASLTVAHVLVPDDAGEEDPEDHAHWQEQLETIRPLNDAIHVNHVLLRGEAAPEIVRYAREMSADLIVMGTHGRTGLDRLLMGSVAEKVLREAACSVLVVKLPRGASGG